MVVGLSPGDFVLDGDPSPPTKGGGAPSPIFGPFLLRPNGSVQRRKVWLTPTAGVLCSNGAKTRNPLKFAGVPQARQQFSAAIGPKFTIL